MKFGPALVLILPVAALPQDLPPGHFPNGFIGFTATCQQTRLDRRNGELVIQAVCPDEAGTRITSSVPINSCIINEGGSLRCERNGGALLSCEFSSGGDFDSREAWLQLDCPDNKGGIVENIFFPLSACISNTNGILTC